MLIYDVQRHPNCGSRDTRDQALDMQAVMAAIAGYFGGYTSKMQPIGERETRQLREAAERKVEGKKSQGAAKDFQKYVRRLVKDLEMKGTIRTALESINLSLHANHPDVLMGECIRTFPTVTCPATLLLKREEIETLYVSGASIIAALHHGHGQKARIYVEAPFDLMYGFRGSDEAVDVLTPYEMMLLYRMERIVPPTSEDSISRATWTSEGTLYRKKCKGQHVKPEYEAPRQVSAAFCCRIYRPFAGCAIVGAGRLGHAQTCQPGLLPRGPRPEFSPEEAHA